MSEIEYQRFIEDHFRIVDKQELSVAFRLNPIQEKLYNNLTGRDIILKARQEGVSSLILAIFLVDFLLAENSRSVCIAHDKDSTIKLFDRVKFFLKAFEDKRGIKVPTRYETRSELVNEKNNAYFYVGTAGSQSFGRSATLTNVHFSEMAFYNDAEKVYLSASQAGTPKRIIIESTANGMGDYYNRMWNEAKEGKSLYTPHFFGWHDNPEYVAPTGTKIEISEEEKKIQNQYKLTDEQMAWRRLKMTEFPTPHAFRQEYPINPDEAFISSGNPVFDPDALNFYRSKEVFIKPPLATGVMIGLNKPTFESQEGGYLKIWAKPDSRRMYVVAGDPADGTKEGDYSCAQVIDVKNLEQVAVWHGKCDADIFGREMIKLGYWYNTAMLVPERNNMGLATILTMRELDYPNLFIREKIGQISDKLTPELGWVTDMKSKPILIAETQRAIRQKALILHDEATLMELYNYQYDDAGHANAPTGAYDDRVMALMIALKVTQNVSYQQASSTNEIAYPDGFAQGNSFDPMATSAEYGVKDFSQ